MARTQRHRLARLSDPAGDLAGDLAEDARSHRAATAEEVLRDNLPLIRRIARRAALCHGLTGADAEDFVQEAQLKLVEDDYRRIRDFHGGSRLPTYLTTVIVRLAKDYRNHLWGKWRPSAAARRLGREGELLERLVYREGFSFEEAVEKMRREARVTRSTEKLAEILARIPPRVSRRVEGEEALAQAPASAVGGDLVETRVVDSEKSRAAEKVEAALREALDELDPRDRLLVLLHYRGWTLAKIARLLKVDSKPLYRRRDRVLAGLREAMETRGVGPAEVRRIVGWEKLDLGLEAGDLATANRVPARVCASSMMTSRLEGPW